MQGDVNQEYNPDRLIEKMYFRNFMCRERKAMFIDHSHYQHNGGQIGDDCH